MRNRIAAAAAVALAAPVFGACSAPSQGQLASTAVATVNGNEVRPRVVRCFQQEWFRTIELGDDASGAKIVVDQRANPASTVSVRFHNFGGFTGTYSHGGGADAATRFDGQSFIITGTANGSTTAKPGEAASADFKINAKC